MNTISIVTPCYNEEGNIEAVYTRVRKAMIQIGRYRYEHLFIDNCSTDRTVEILKRIASFDTNVKIIVNARNFGHVRSPMHGIHNATGDVVIGIVADLQDPPELIPRMVREWENGYSMVLMVKTASEESPLMFWVRRKYYRVVNRLSSIETFENFTGFGLYDRRVIDAVKSFNDPYPYFRGMIAEIGLPYKMITYEQYRRRRGVSKNNWYSLYDLGILGVTNHSKVPLHLVTFAGFAGAALSMAVGLGYLFYKLLFWGRFPVGVAPLVIGLFFFTFVQLASLGIIGEYVGSIHTYVQKRPLVVERERVNFAYQPGAPLVDTALEPVCHRVGVEVHKTNCGRSEDEHILIEE